MTGFFHHPSCPKPTRNQLRSIKQDTGRQRNENRTDRLENIVSAACLWRPQGR